MFYQLWPSETDEKIVFPQCQSKEKTTPAKHFRGDPTEAEVAGTLLHGFNPLLILRDTGDGQRGAPAANKCETPALPYPLRVLESLNEESPKPNLIYLLIRMK